MMKKKITALLVGIFTLVISSYAQVSVTFTATPSVICPGDTVRFTNTSAFYPTLWTWYMPGSSLSIDTNSIPPGNPPPVTYKYPGKYYVTCVVVNATSRDSVTTQNCVIVNAAPTAIIMPPSGGICDTSAKGRALDTVFFTLVDTTFGSKYRWEPDTVRDSLSLTCKTCKDPGAYPRKTTVFTLTVTGQDGCVAKVYDTVTVGKIIAKITGRDSICVGMYDTLTASGGSEGGSNRTSKNPGSTYIWNNGKTTSSIIVDPLVTTKYSVVVSSGTGPCISDTSFVVNVFPLPIYSFSLSPADSICYPGSATITITQPVTKGLYQYYWYGPPYGLVDTNSFTVSPQVNTTYTLVVRHIGCYVDSVIRIKVNTMHRPFFSGPTNLCQGSPATISITGDLQYHWSTGQTTSSINVKPVITTTYSVLASSGACLYPDTSFTIHVDSVPHFKFTGDTSICTGTSTIVYASPVKPYGNYGYTYLWNTGSIVDSVITGNLTADQSYYLTISKGACSLDDSIVTVKVYPRPNPSLFPSDTLVCEYDSVPLTATGGNYYIWTAYPKPGSLNHYMSRYYNIPNDTDVNMAAPPVNTKYTVKVCTWGCCTNDTIGFVPMPVSPTATINIIPGVQGYSVCCNETVTGGTPVQLNATYSPGPYYVEGWSPSTGLSCTTCNNPTSVVFNTTTYVVTFADLSTGCLVNDSVTVDIFNCNVFIPNVFSPNGDGVNDLLYVRSICLKSMNFAVFDRWGNKVFETADQNTPWDGTYKGKSMEIGTYMWFLTGLLENGTHVSQSGNVTLVR